MYKHNTRRRLGAASLLAFLYVAVYFMVPARCDAASILCNTDVKNPDVRLHPEKTTFGSRSTSIGLERRQVREEGTSPPPIDSHGPDLFAIAQARGRKLLGFVANPSLAGPESFSEWQDVREAKAWGWSSTKNTDIWEKKRGEITKDLKDNVFREKRFHLNNPNDSPLCSMTHVDSTSHQQIDEAGNLVLDAQRRPVMVQYPSSGGNFNNFISPRQGLIIAETYYSPQWYANGLNKIQLEGKPLPRLQKWSDLVFFEWLEVADRSNVKGLRYILRYNIREPSSKELIRDVVQRGGILNGIPPPWPGFILTGSGGRPGERDAFEVLVGSANVNGVAWMILQHADILGTKRIASIQLWNLPGNAFDPCILVELETPTEQKVSMKQMLPMEPDIPKGKGFRERLFGKHSASKSGKSS